jgi:hypothetical protein
MATTATAVSNTLAQLQSNLQAHVLRGEQAIAAQIDVSEDIPAATRLGVYANAYRVRLIEGLQSNFPHVAYLLGDEQFSELGQAYLDAYPSQHFSIRWFGHRLPEFVLHQAPYNAQPWLHELATWEWTVAGAFDAADAEPLTNDDLARVAPQEWPGLSFAVHPSLRKIVVQHNIAALAKAAADQDPEPPPPQLLMPTHWCIWRQDLQVRYRSLAEEENAALQAVMNGACFGELCEVLSEYQPVDQVPLRAATLLKTWIHEQWLVQSKRDDT